MSYDANDEAVDLGEAVDLNSTTPQASETPAIPDAVTAKFDEIFGSGRKAGEPEPVAEQADTEVQANNRRRVNAEIKQQRDELIEEGREDEDRLDPAETAEAAEDDETGGDESGEAVTAETPAAATTQLDPGLRFAANQMGWSDEKIDRLVKADPEVARETFESLAETYTNLSRQFLPTGTQVAPGLPAVQPQQPAQEQSPSSQLDKLYADLETFAEANGSDIVDKFLKPLKSEFLDPVRQLIAANKVTEQRLVAQEAQGTMKTLASKFGQLYGPAEGALSGQYKQARANLAQLADQIRAGAKMQGQELTVTDALNRAHLILSASHRDQAVRNQIKEQVQKRTKSITAKPVARRNPVNVAAKSDAAAMEAYSRALQAKGIEVD